MREVLLSTLRRASLLSAGALMLLQGLVPVTAFATQPPQTNEVPYWCGNGGGVKFDSNEVSVGNHTEGHVSLTITKPAAKTVVSDISSSSVEITKVVVKGSSTGGNQGGGNELYMPPFTFPLVAPNNNGGQQSDVSHVIVCYQTGSIKVVKDSRPSSNDDFDFTVKKGQQTVATFELEDDDNNNDGKPDNATVQNLTAGDYVITESPEESNWVVSDVVCTNGVAIVKDLANGKVTVSLGSGKQTTCTFVNEHSGKIKVNKRVDDNANGNYEGSNGTAQSLGFVWGINGETPNRSMGSTSAALPVGNYSVSENVMAGYMFTGWYYTSQEDNHGSYQVNCENPQSTSMPTNLKVETGKTTEITLCNQRRTGMITIIKDSRPNDQQNFSFTATGSGVSNFTLDDDAGANGANGYYSNTKSFSGLLAGSVYSFTEQAEDGWSLADIVCEGQGVQRDLMDRKVTITLAPNDSVVCRFINHKHGTITVYKETVPVDAAGSFEATANTANGKVYGASSKEFSNTTPAVFKVGFGTYDIVESDFFAPGNWVNTTNTCTGIVINEQNLSASCTITNVKLAEVQISKHAYGDTEEAGTSFGFTSTLDSLGTFNLKDGEYASNSNVLPGSYTVTETVPEGWTLDYVYCEGAGKYSLDGDSLIFSVSAGNEVHCHFFNQRNGSMSGHKFDDVNGNGSWDEGESGLSGWTVTLEKQVCEYAENDRSTLSLFSEINEYEIPEQSCWFDKEDETVTDEDGAYRFDNLMYGYYRVCEVQQDGWTQTYPNEDGCHYEYIGEVIDADGLDFGNFQLGRVSGFKFNDSNANRAYDEGEEKLENWTIQLQKCEYAARVFSLTRIADSDAVAQCEWVITQQTTTDENGMYSFDGLDSGSYKVCEMQQAGWTRMLPEGSDCYSFEVEVSGTVVAANFGNKASDPGNVLSTTTRQLANTGTPMLQGLLVSLSIIGAAAGVTYLGRRKISA